MDTPFRVEAPPAEPTTPYTPAGPPEPLLFDQFQGINTSTTRAGVDDKQAYWLDGFMPIGPRFARTLYDIGPAIHSEAGKQIAFFAFNNIGATPYCIVVHTDGSIHAVNTSTLTSSEIAPAGTITSPSRASVGTTQWGSQYVIIVAQQTNGYFLWDGTTFYLPGQPAPGGGTVPTGIQGSSIEIYAARVWIANGAVITFSAPGSFTNFATNAGGGNFTSSDSFLRVAFTQLIQTNGFLYLIADSSINYISGVQTSGSPPTTVFTNQNADPEVGSPWAGTVDVFGRNIVFANAFGAHISYGAAVTKISDALDGVYNTVPNFAGFTPSAAKAIIFGKKVWILLVPIIDPVSGQQVNKLFMWDGKKWWSSQQSVPIVYIQHQEINSVLTAYGTDGTSIYPLFTTPSSNFVKTAQSKLWTKSQLMLLQTTTRVWGAAQYYSTNSPDLTISVDNEVGASSATASLAPTKMVWTTQSGAVMNWTTNGVTPMVWRATGIAIIPPTALTQNGTMLGITVATSSADMALIMLAIDVKLPQFRG